MQVVRLSTLRIGRLYPQEIFFVLISVKRVSTPQGHVAAGRIISMKNHNILFVADFTDHFGESVYFNPASTAIGSAGSLCSGSVMKITIISYL
jgi:hypothetical protein